MSQMMTTLSIGVVVELELLQVVDVPGQTDVDPVVLVDLVIGHFARVVF